MRILTFSLTMLAAPALAGTLTIEWVGGPQTFEGFPDGPQIGPPYEAAFVFSVPYLVPSRFSYGGIIDPDTFLDVATRNPYEATLVSRPDGHLGGYLAGSYGIEVFAAGVQLSAGLSDNDDHISMTSTRILESHNQGLFTNRSSGYWTATYLAGSPDEGESFAVLAPIPLPAGLPLLALGIAVLGAVGAGRARQGTGVAAA